jgi:hypothetical protein
MNRNADFLRRILPDRVPRSFAYPYGDIDLGRKALIAGRFPICRGIWPGLNRGRMDFAQLKAVALDRDQVADIDIDAWLDHATAAKAW